MKWLPNTDHGTHSHDNVDLGWPRNAKVIGFRDREPGRKGPGHGQNPSGETKVGEVCALSGRGPATHNQGNDQDG
jgi:hypothetical protein